MYVVIKFNLTRAHKRGLNMINNDKELFAKLIKLFKPYKKKISLIVALMLLSICTSILLPVVNKYLVDTGLMAKNFSKVIYFSLIMIMLVTIDELAGLFEAKYLAIVNSMMRYRLESKSFRHLMKIRIDFFNHNNSVQIINNLQVDISNICKISDRETFFIIAQIFKMIGGLIGLMILSIKLTLVVVIISPIRYFVVKYLSRKRMKLFEDMIKYNSEYSSWYGDTLCGIKEIKLWGLSEVKGREFVKKQRNLINTNISISIMDKINQISDSIIMNFMINAVYIMGAYKIFNSTLTIGSLFAFVSYSVFVTGPISAIMNIMYNFSNVIPSAKRFFAFMEEEHEENIKNKTASIEGLHNIKGNIAFENVSYSYGDKRVISNLSLTINSGEKVAIVGENGSGKSTLTKLLLRFYKPDKGRILIDGADINNFNIKAYRKLFSVVSQEVYLFNTSIIENIRLFSKVNSSKIKAAIEDSNVDEFIQNIPGKYETKVGVNGLALSGGQRQKIAMARALAKEYKFLILDEATSNYDIDSESRINEFICNCLKNKTVIVITHRLKILEKMDKVLLIDNGQILDSGSHEELYERNVIYKNMIDRKIKKDEEVC